MGDQRSTVTLEGDVGPAVASLRLFDAAVDSSAQGAQGLASALSRAEADAEALARATEDAAAEQRKLTDEAEQSAEEIARAVAERRTEAELLEHEARRLRAMGGEQERIGELQRRALTLRQQAAELAGRETEATKLARQQEVQILREVEAARKEASRREAAAARDRERHIREWEAAEKAAARQIIADQEKIERAEERAAKAREQAWHDAEAEAREYARRLEQIEEHTRRIARESSTVGLAQRGFQDVADKVNGFRQQFDSITNAAGAIGNIVTGFESFVNLLGQAYDIANEIAGESIEAKNVANNLQVNIAGARDAFKGYVDDVELAKIANQAFELGVISTGEELEELARGVQVKAERLGVDSTQLFENAVTAIGRGSALILDNLGIILDQAKAEKIYAQSLGITVKQLSALQKEEAFQKAALIEIAKAGKDVEASVDGMAEAWRRGVVDWKNFRKEVLGFDDTVGRIRDGLRRLDEEQLERLRFGEVADDASQAGKELNAMLAEWGLSLDDIRLLAAETGVSYQELIDGASNDIAVRTAERARKELEATHKDLAAALTKEADKIDHNAAMIEAGGAKQKEVLALQEESLMLRLEAAEAVKDEAAALEVTRQIELLRAKQDAPKKRGGRRDPNAGIDRELELTRAQIQAERDVLAAEREREVEATARAEIDARLVDLARQELDARQQAAEARKVRTADDRTEREIELLEIATERQLLDMEVAAQAEEEAKRQATERLAAMDREIERLDSMGVATQLLERQRQDAHVQFVAEFGSTEELAQAEHERDMTRRAEKQAFEVQQAQVELDAYNREIELEQARGVVVEDAAIRRLELEAMVAAAEGDNDRRRQLLHQREVARIRERHEAQRKAQQAANDILTQGQSLFTAITNAAVKDEAKRERASLRARGVEAMARGALSVVESVAAFASFNVVQGALHAAAAAVAFVQGGTMLAGKIPSGGGASGGGAASASGGFGTGGQFSRSEWQTTVAEGQEGRARAEAPISAEALARANTSMVERPASGAGGGGQVIQFNNSTVVTGDTGGLFSDLGDRQTTKNWGAG